ncbi:MAG TPA: IclR family transcriptional regulator [Acidimicrobiales bacterium]|nr:IclR family transcriptional regulator [Acidimicrobiales bacterium]
MAATGDGRREVRSGAQSVERALAVLRCFEQADRSLGVSGIAATTGLSVSTAHRLTRALCAGGLLMQDPRSERYLLGPVLVVLGRRAEDQLGYARALPALESLAEATGESVNLGIRSGAEVLVVLAVPSRQPLRFDQLAGSRVPIHTSAMGKCLLAFAAPEPAGADAVSELPRLSRFTDRTITRRDQLVAELERTRARGWALNDEERNPGVRAVAAPVLGGSGWAIAAVAVQGPAMRLPNDRLVTVAGQVVEATEAVGPVLRSPS